MAKFVKIKRYNYDRRRQRNARIFRNLLIVAIILIFGAVGWFAFDPINRLVSGFQLPNFGSSQEEPSVSSESSQSSVPSVPAVPESGEHTGLPEKTAYLPSYTLLDPASLSAALDSLKAQGIEGVAFELKDATGVVLYDSQLEIVANNLALSSAPYSLETVTAAILEHEMTPVGVLYTFRDHVSTASMYDAAVKYMDSQINWIDNAQSAGGVPWLNPNHPMARDYLVQLVEEASRRGVEYILLDGLQFPEGYSLELATYGNTGPLDKSAVLAEFVTQAEAAAAANGGEVWPVMNLTSLSRLSTIRCGEQPELILAAAGRAMLDVRPEQFGAGITTEELTLSDPLLDPAGTITAVLAVCEDTLAAAGGEDTPLQLAAMVQAYTSTAVSGGGNRTYTAADVVSQEEAAAQYGVTQFYRYSPSGIYPQQ